MQRIIEKVEHAESDVWFENITESAYLKIGSKYSQDLWHASHSSITSCVICSLLSQFVIRSSNTFLYGENDMLCVMTI